MAIIKIITYHFIKDEKDSFYDKIVGLKKSEFIRQINFLKKELLNNINGRINI